MIDELPRCGPIPRILTRLGLVMAGFVAMGLIAAGVVGVAWFWR